MLSDNQKRWGIEQWAAFLSDRELPCLPRSKAALLSMEASRGELLSARELAEIAAADPFLCVRILREAENRRVHRLEHDTTTPLGAVMQLGTESFRAMLLSCPEADQSNAGLLQCEARCYQAHTLALRWGSARADVSPDEIAMAAQLSELGELLLWLFAGELPAAALKALHDGRARRSAQAQLDVCGFRFKDLTFKCATIWHLPPLLTQLIRGVDSPRANLSRICVDTARHLSSEGPESPALPADVAEARQLIPGATLDWLADQLPDTSPAQAEAIAQKAADLLDPQQPQCSAS